MWMLLVLFLGYASPERISTFYFQTETKDDHTVWDDPWLARDKLDHFWGSFVIAGMGTIWVSSTLGDDVAVWYGAGFGISLSVGLVKEILDNRQPGNRFSWRDMAANTAGALLASIFLFMVAPR